MASKHYFTGVTGLYLVAAALSKRKFIVSPTSRSANTADLLITDEFCQNAYAIQVKSNSTTFNFWLVGVNTSRIKSETFVYVFVNLRKTGPEYHIVPSTVVATKVREDKPTDTRKTTWYSIYLKEIAEFKDRWDVFLQPKIELPD